MSKSPINSILVIDDDDAFRKRLARAFRDRELKVFEASCESQAVESIRDFKPDAAVLDLKLKEESGLEILKKLSAIDSKIKILILTGYGTITTAVDALKSGAINYLTKPVDADTILAAFEGVAAKNKSPASPSLEQVEWEHIHRVVNDNDGNITKASKALGLHRRSLQRKLNKAPSQLK